jgi:predicted membrane GTPase involved in stress response
MYDREDEEIIEIDPDDDEPSVCLQCFADRSSEFINGVAARQDELREAFPYPGRCLICRAPLRGVGPLTGV